MTEQIKIDRNIPIPPHGQTRYPFREMEVGDSILVTNQSSAGIWKKVTGWKFTTRKEGNRFRVWRTE